MKLTRQLQVFINTGIFLAVIGSARSTTERITNQTEEVVTVHYESEKSNVSATYTTVPHDETELTDSPVNVIDYEDSSEEVNDDLVMNNDSDGLTTENYENSKRLYSYVIPVTSEKAPQMPKDEEIEEDDNQGVAVHEEEEKEEEENSRVSEGDEEYAEEESIPYHRIEEEDEDEEEEEEEERRLYNRSENLIGRENYLDDSEEEHYETEDDHGRTDDEVSTEKGSTSTPSNPWRHSYPHVIREKKPFLEFTTVQPYSEPRPVSYSSIVYDPDGKSKTELSGSFYKKPLKLVQESEVFHEAEEHVSEVINTAPVTSQAIIEERSIQSPDEEFVRGVEEEGIEEDYIESKSMQPMVKQNVTTVKPKGDPKPVHTAPKQNFEWEEEDYYIQPEGVQEHKVPDVVTVKPRRTLNPVQPTPLPIFNWEEGYMKPEAVTSKENYKSRDTTTDTPNQKPVQSILRQNFEWEEQGYTEPETATTRIMQNKKTFTPKRIPNLVRPIPRHHFDWIEDEPITEKYEEMEYFQEASKDVQDDQLIPKRYNEKTNQQFRDKSNRENYYEQTINTRFGSKEKETSEEGKNYESEVGDLMKPKIEELRHETIQDTVLSEEDEVEPEDMIEREIPTKKDRNQLYEYLIADGRFKQGVSENKESLLRQVLTTPKEEVTETEPPPPPKTTEPPKPKTTVTPKPQRYSFGTITNPKSNRFMTFNNGETDDDTYNRMVSNIQSLFMPSTQRPTVNYEQHFLPTHGNCQHQLPEHDSINYESFIKSSQTRPPSYEEDEDEEEEEEEEESPMPKRLPMKTYIIQKRPLPMPKKEIHYRPVKKPSAIKVTVRPMPYKEAKPVMYRSAVYLGPAASSNQLVRKIIHYTPKEQKSKRYHYSPSNQILRIIPPKRTSRRMLIIRKIE